MNLINLISFLDTNDIAVKDAAEVCCTLKPALSVVGYVIWAIKVLVPIALIVIGMIKLASAVMSKSDDAVKKAQDSLIKKLIVSVIVFLVPTLVVIVMRAVGNETYELCWDMVNDPLAIKEIFSWDASECN